VALAARDVHVERPEAVGVAEREIEEAVAFGEAVELILGRAGEDLVEPSVRDRWRGTSVGRRSARLRTGRAASAKERSEGKVGAPAKGQHCNVQHDPKVGELIFTFKFKQRRWA
jgi:hypothetical protein